MTDWSFCCSMLRAKWKTGAVFVAFLFSLQVYVNYYCNTPSVGTADSFIFVLIE